MMAGTGFGPIAASWDRYPVPHADFVETNI